MKPSSLPKARAFTQPNWQARRERGQWECMEKRGSPLISMGFSAQGLFRSTKLPPQGTDATGQNQSLGCPPADKPRVWPGGAAVGGGVRGAGVGAAPESRRGLGSARPLTPADPPEGKPVSPETSQFYSECLNSFKKCKKSAQGWWGIIPRSTLLFTGWGVRCWDLHHQPGTATSSSAALSPQQGDAPAFPSHKNHTTFLDTPLPLHLPAGSPRVKKPLSISA